MTRRKLPTDRSGYTHRMRLHDAAGELWRWYLTCNFYPEDGSPGELFLECDRSGTPEDGLAHCWAQAVSLLLQSGWYARVQELADKFAFERFAPAGGTGYPLLPTCTSIVDYASRWLCLAVATRAANHEAGGKAMYEVERFELGGHDGRHLVAHVRGLRVPQALETAALSPDKRRVLERLLAERDSAPTAEPEAEIAEPTDEAPAEPTDEAPAEPPAQPEPETPAPTDDQDPAEQTDKKPNRGGRRRSG